ncbi:hypothetical protein SAURM35S_06718 [Streptomyces aurantiogriseus]
MSDGHGGNTKRPRSNGPGSHSRADDEARTRDLNLGKVALYQLSYVVGLMPHPEHAVEPLIGTGRTDGLPFFTSILKKLVNA